MMGIVFSPSKNEAWVRRSELGGRGLSGSIMDCVRGVVFLFVDGPGLEAEGGIVDDVDDAA